MKTKTETTAHQHPRWMVPVMALCLVLGVTGVFVDSLLLEVGFVASMGFCLGHYVYHKVKHDLRKHDANH